MLDFIAMQISRVNREKGYYVQSKTIWRLAILLGPGVPSFQTCGTLIYVVYLSKASLEEIGPAPSPLFYSHYLKRITF